jgi:hypothetical protein
MNVEKTLQRTEEAVLAAAALLPNDPQSVNLPGATTPTLFLRQYTDDLRRIIDLPAAVLRANGFGPDPPHGITVRLRTAAGQLHTPQRDAAASLINAFHEQVSRYAVMPGEADWRAATVGQSTAVLGDRVGALLRTVDRQRGLWATAWARGTPPEAASPALESLHRLMGHVRSAETLASRRGGPVLLNRWSAWELDPDVAQQLGTAQIDSLIAAVDLALTGRFADLARAIDQLERDKPVSLLIAELHAVLAEPLQKLPDGPTLTLSQLLLDPPSVGLLADYADDLALLCRAIQELAHPRVASTDSLRDKTRQVCVETATRLLAAAGR